MKSTMTTTILSLAIIALPITSSNGAEFVFTKIADTSDSVPSLGSETFTGFGSASVDGDDVAFLGVSASRGGGIYLFSQGSISRIADITTNVPDSGNIFDGIGTFGHDDGVVAFLGSHPSGKGLYSFQSGALGVLVDTTNSPPGGSNFTNFDQPSVSNGRFTVLGWVSSSDNGVYSDIGGTLQTIADKNTAIPSGTGSFDNFGKIPGSMSGTNIAFRGKGTAPLQNGVYTSIGGSLNVVADLTTSIPDGSGTFTFFEEITMSGDFVTFRAHGTGQEGIYTDLGGSLATVVDLTTTVPGAGGTFSGFGIPSLDGNTIVFRGQPAGLTIPRGLYAYRGGTLSKVIDTTDTLDGKSPTDFDTYGPSLDGDVFAFRVYFSDGSRAIYTATVPEPTTLTLAACALLGLFGRRKRR